MLPHYSASVCCTVTNLATVSFKKKGVLLCLYSAIVLVRAKVSHSILILVRLLKETFIYQGMMNCNFRQPLDSREHRQLFIMMYCNFYIIYLFF